MVIRPLIAYSQAEEAAYIPIREEIVDNHFINKNRLLDNETEQNNYLEANSQISEQLYNDWITARVQAAQRRKQSRAKGYTPCSCVSYAKFRTGFTQSVGFARNWPRNSLIPHEGGIVITNESSVGHVGFIERVKVGEMDVIEANFVTCKVTSRTIKLDDPVILGYWKGL